MGHYFRLLVLSLVALSCYSTWFLVGASKAAESKAVVTSKTEKSDSVDSRKSAVVSPTDGASLEKTHALFSAQLEKYVTDSGVNYTEWKSHPEPLKEYLRALSKIDKNEYQKLSQDEKLVFWINAYNAYTIKLVLDNYPIRGTKTYYPTSSIRQIEGFWENNSIELVGRKVTLESMEHDILRRDFQEPRTHFAVVCAAKGCAPISRAAYSASTIDEQLNNAAKAFLSNPKNVKIDYDKKTIEVSSLFKWFPLDFANVVGLGKRFPPPTDDEIVASYILSEQPEATLKNFGPDDSKAFKVIYKEYDWGLNDSIGSETKTPVTN